MKWPRWVELSLAGANTATLIGRELRKQIRCCHFIIPLSLSQFLKCWQDFWRLPGLTFLSKVQGLRILWLRLGVHSILIILSYSVKDEKEQITCLALIFYCFQEVSRLPIKLCVWWCSQGMMFTKLFIALLGSATPPAQICYLITGLTCEFNG